LTSRRVGGWKLIPFIYGRVSPSAFNPPQQLQFHRLPAYHSSCTI
jgi:hypothetical protein